MHTTLKFNRVDTVAIIAGNGDFPLACVKAAKENGAKVIVCGHKGETKPEIELLADKFCWIKVGQVGKVIKFLKHYDCTQVIFTGGISRPSLFKAIFPDWTGLKVIKKAGSLRDDIILRAAAEELAKNGINLFSSSDLLNDYLATTGCITSRGLTETEKKDAEYGWNIAKTIGSFDIGQTVVITDKIVTAIECVEGTDKAIIRAGELTANKTSVVVKVPKPQQDRRLDLPSIGLKTIENMINARASALVLENHGAMILNPQEVISLANANNIAIEVWDKN